MATPPCLPVAVDWAGEEAIAIPVQCCWRKVAASRVHLVSCSNTGPFRSDLVINLFLFWFEGKRGDQLVTFHVVSFFKETGTWSMVLSRCWRISSQVLRKALIVGVWEFSSIVSEFCAVKDWRWRDSILIKHIAESNWLSSCATGSWMRQWLARSKISQDRAGYSLFSDLANIRRLLMWQRWRGQLDWCVRLYWTLIPLPST